MKLVCFVSSCHRPATTAAIVRVSGTPSRWLLCDDHVAMMNNLDLPEGFEVHDLDPAFPTDAEEGVKSRRSVHAWDRWLYAAWEVHEFPWQPDDFDPERKGHRLCSVPKCHSTPEWTVVTGLTESVRRAT